MAKTSGTRDTTPRPQALATISWEGDSHKAIKKWPPLVRQDFGLSLFEMQHGREALLEVRPMSSVGPGVFELKTQDADKWYRLMYLARIQGVIYVLDCFEKDTRKTERRDLERSRSRYQQVQQELREGRRDAKQKQKK